MPAEVQLTDRQFKALQEEARATGKSVEELIREGIDEYLAGRGASERAERIERAILVAGKFSSGLSDVSAMHDKHLADAFGK